MEGEHVYVLGLSEELRKAAKGVFVNVVVIDNAPSGFVARALKKGGVLVERVPGLRTHLLIKALEDEVRFRRRS